MKRISQNVRVATDHIHAMRHFNRFYTRVIGILQDGSLYKPYSLAEARVLYEIGIGDAQAREIAEQLQLDEAYLSRIMSKFEKSGLIIKEPSPADRRQNFLRLTAAGKKVLLDLNARSNETVSALLKSLSSDQRLQLLDAMGAVERLLTQEKE